MPITLADPAAYGLNPIACAEVPELRSAWAKVFMDRAQRQRIVILTRDHHFVDDDGTLAPEGQTWANGPAASLVADRGLYAAVVTNAGLGVLERANRGGIRWLTPSRPLAQVGGRAARLTGWQGLDWTWALGRAGVKLLSDPVPAVLGAVNYVFPYQLVGGYAAPAEQADGTLTWGGFSIPRAFVIGADSLRYPCGRWQSLPGSRVGFRFDDSALPAEAFPYRIDPTSTFTSAASGDDGDLQGAGGSYPPSFGAVETSAGSFTAQKAKLGGNYFLRTALIQWDTSSMSGQTISSGQLNLYCNFKGDADSKTLEGEYYAASNWPIDLTDAVTDIASSTAFTGVTVASFTSGAYNLITITNPDANINKSGYSGFRMAMATGAPTGDNTLQFNEYDTGSNKPQLLLATPDYSDPGGGPPHRRYFVMLGR